MVDAALISKTIRESDWPSVWVPARTMYLSQTGSFVLSPSRQSDGPRAGLHTPIKPRLMAWHRWTCFDWEVFSRVSSPEQGGGAAVSPAVVTAANPIEYYGELVIRL